MVKKSFYTNTNNLYFKICSIQNRFPNPYEKISRKLDTISEKTFQKLRKLGYFT